MTLLLFLQQQSEKYVGWDIHEMWNGHPVYVEMFVVGSFLLTIIGILYSFELVHALVIRGLVVRNAMRTLNVALKAEDVELFWLGVNKLPVKSPEYALKERSEPNPTLPRQRIPDIITAAKSHVQAGLRIYYVRVIRIAKLCAAILIWSLVVLAKNLSETGWEIEESRQLSGLTVGHYLHETFGLVGAVWLMCATLLLSYLFLSWLLNKRLAQWQQLVTSAAQTTSAKV